MVTTRRCIVLPVETDRLFSVRGLISEGYVRVQIGRNDFFIPPNILKRAFFALEGDSMKIGDRQNGGGITFQRIENGSNGEGRIRFISHMKSGDTKDTVIPSFVMEEIVERIDQVKALLHSYSEV